VRCQREVGIVLRKSENGRICGDDCPVRVAQEHGIGADRAFDMPARSGVFDDGAGNNRAFHCIPLDGTPRRYPAVPIRRTQPASTTQLPRRWPGLDRFASIICLRPIARGRFLNGVTGRANRNRAEVDRLVSVDLTASNQFQACEQCGRDGCACTQGPVRFAIG
jgi:hypothetical protein